jgi:hypothetical protein
MALAIFWLIGITNAINLLDNMDGLASGIASSPPDFWRSAFVNSGQYTEALISLIFAGALLGFLVYNSNPASIFMGDCGSMFVGFFLASSALINVSGGDREVSAGAGGADPGSVHSHLRHDVRHVLRKLSVARRRRADAITRRTGWSRSECPSVTRSGCSTALRRFRACWRFSCNARAST